MATETSKPESPIDWSAWKTRYPIEEYTPERVAEFLLSNSLNADDYARAVEEVRKLGLDPEKIPHYKPPGV